MKFIKDNIITKMSQQYASEPIIVVSIHWQQSFLIENYKGKTDYTDAEIDLIINYGVKNSSFNFYADKEITNSEGNLIIPGKILEISEIESSVNFDGNANSSQVTVVIDDSDDSILNILKTSPIHKRPANVYLYFEGMSLGDMIVLFEGEIVSDFKWTEKNKTVTFNFLSHIEEREVGFSPEQGYIQDLPLELIGRPWPFGFGDVVKYPALRINYTPTAVLAEPFGIHDYGIDVEMDRLLAIKNSMQGVAESYFKAALEAYFSELNDLGDQLTDLGNQAIVIVQTVTQASGDLEQVLTEQLLYEHGLNIRSGQEGNVRVITDVPLKLHGLFEVGDMIIRGKLSPSGQRTGKLNIQEIVHPLPGATTWGNDYFPPQKEGFKFFNAGTTIRFLGQYPLRYIANTTGGSVKGVYAYRNFEGAKRLQPVPKKYWGVLALKTVPGGVVTTVPNYTALCVELHQPLSSLRNQFWEDDLYISYTSTVGPNIKNILKFLIAHYTHNRYDERSMKSLPSYNCSFVLPDQKDVMAVIKEICFQCNIAVWLTEGVFFFQNLRQFYFSRMLLDVGDIIQDSVEISISPTENIVTKMKGAWRYNYQYDIENFVAIRYNDNIYGVSSYDTNYYCFQDPKSVMTSMQYWIYRKGNVWKRMKFQASLKFIQLDIFDNIALTASVVEKYALGDLGVDLILDCNIISIKLNTQTYTVEIEIELPIYVGSKKKSPAYWINFASGIPFFKIDENFELTETPKQYLFYQRGFSISKAISGVKLQSEFFNALSKDSIGATQNGLPSPNSMNGDPRPSGIDGQTVTDTGGNVNQYSSPRVEYPQQTGQFVIANQPNWQYQFGQYPTDLKTKADTGNCFPGQVQDQAKGKIYSCLVYPKGIHAKGQKIVATQLQISLETSGEIIPKGTWALFSKTTNDEGSEEYWFQVPVWMG